MTMSMSSKSSSSIGSWIDGRDGTVAGVGFVRSGAVFKRNVVKTVIDTSDARPENTPQSAFVRNHPAVDLS